MVSEVIIWLYIIRGEQGRYYTGITNDIDRRLKEHRSGASKSTVRYGEIELVWTKTFRDRKEARDWEVMIKKKGAKRWLKTYGQLNEKAIEGEGIVKGKSGVSSKEKYSRTKGNQA